jgi:hypothetical protein
MNASSGTSLECPEFIPPSVGQAHALNNFGLKAALASGIVLPGVESGIGLYRPGESHGAAFYRWMEEEANMVDQRDFAAHSDLYLGRTPAEFERDIELALRLCKITETQILAMTEARMKSTPHGCVPDSDAILLPAYKMLRSWGYSHRDLVE